MTTAPIPFDLQYAMNTILEEYGDKVALDTAQYPQKWGSRADIASTEVTVNELRGVAHETLLTTNGITHVVSTDVDDTQILEVRGKTISSGVLTHDEQTVTLNGQTPVALTTPIARVDRAWNDAGTGNELEGQVSFYEGGAQVAGVVTDTAELHALILVTDDQQTEKCAKSIPGGQYWIVEFWGGSILSKTSAAVDLKLQMRKKEKLFRRLSRIGLNTTGTTTDQEKGPFIITPNSDVRVTAKSTSGSGVAVEAFMKGYSVSIVNP